MGWIRSGAAAGIFSFAAVTFCTSAAAAQSVPSGTFAVSAERLVASNFHRADGNTWWNNQFFGAGGAVPHDTPRLGLDYFVVDGLSIGGHAAVGFYVPPSDDNPDTRTTAWGVLVPRVGFAFALGSSVDFWPRIGAGAIFADGADTFLLEIDAMFLFNVTRGFAIELGPAMDIPTADEYPDFVVGANGGLVMSF